MKRKGFIAVCIACQEVRVHDLFGQDSWLAARLARLKHACAAEDLFESKTATRCAKEIPILVLRKKITNLSVSNAILTLSLTWKIQSSNPVGSPDNGNNRRGDRLPFQPPACAHTRPSNQRN